VEIWKRRAELELGLRRYVRCRAGGSLLSCRALQRRSGRIKKLLIIGSQVVGIILKSSSVEG
jgi:hypothetical protein